MNIRWRRVSQEERDRDRFEAGRQGAFARGARQAARQDLPPSRWRPGPVPPPRQVRRQQRELTARRADPRSDLDRAKTLARAMQQAQRERTR